MAGQPTGAQSHDDLVFLDDLDDLIVFNALGDLVSLEDLDDIVVAKKCNSCKVFFFPRTKVALLYDIAASMWLLFETRYLKEKLSWWSIIMSLLIISDSLRLTVEAEFF